MIWMIFMNDEMMRPYEEHEEHMEGLIVQLVDSQTARPITTRLEGGGE